MAGKQKPEQIYMAAIGALIPHGRTALAAVSRRQEAEYTGPLDSVNLRRAEKGKRDIFVI